MPQKLCGSPVWVVAPLMSAVFVAGSAAIGAALPKLSLGGGETAAAGMAAANPRLAASSAATAKARDSRVIWAMPRRRGVGLPTTHGEASVECQAIAAVGARRRHLASGRVDRFRYRSDA